MKEKQTRRPWLAFLITLFMLAGVAGSAYGLYRLAVNKAEDYYRSRYLTFTFSNEDYDYSESTAKLPDPGGSFYHMTGYYLSDDKDEAEFKERLLTETGWYESEEYVLVEINLAGYRDRALSDAALSQTEQILQVWSDAGDPIILRFLYDWDGNSAETEPDDLALIQTHMSQVAPIVNAHAKDIFTMQGIFVGDYAEMHGGKHMDVDSMCTLAEHLDSVIDPNIFLAVRTPAQRRLILGSAEAFPERNTFATRLGLYNDGMLGSITDLGTYGDIDRAQSTGLGDHWLREQELEYQNEVCQKLPNGGEAVIDNPLNDLEQAIEALSVMHVSYLSCMHHAEVIDKWRESTIHTNDAWNGMSGYDYIDAHLGARYRCTGTAAASFDFWSEDGADLKITLTNTGFSNFYEPLSLQVSIVPEDDAAPVSTVSLPEDELGLLTNGETCTISLPLELRELPEGSYRICLFCTREESQKEVAFATDLPLTGHGYEVASFSVSRTPTTIPSDKELLERYLSHVRDSKNSLAK